MSDNGNPTLIETTLQGQRVIELYLLTCAFKAPEETITECGFIKPEDFATPEYGKFWKILMSSRDNILAATEAGVITEILKHVPDVHSWDAPKYASQIQRQAYLVRRAKDADQLAKAVANRSYEMARQVVDNMALDVPFAAHRPENAVDGFTRLIDIINEPERRILPTYIAPIDIATGGMEPQTLTVLGAETRMGKSTIAFQIARNVAASGHKVIYFSLEMSAIHLWGKAACGPLGIRWRDVLNGNLTEGQKSELTESAGELMGILHENLLIEEDANMNTDLLWQVVAKERPEFVIVDVMKLLTDSGDNEVQRLGYITRRLKAIAKQFDLPLWALHHINRANLTRSNQRPQLRDLRDSGHIEENADVVYMLYREDLYKDEPVGRYSKTEFLIRKTRYDVGDGRILLQFDTEQQWFERLP